MRNYEIRLLDSKELDRVVKIYIKVPNKYNESTKPYPVLYCHDGQVLFNDFEEFDTGFGLMNQFINDEDSKEVIVVGIDSVKNRLGELVPFPITLQNGTKCGEKIEAYFAFIKDTLIPHIEQQYRVLKGPEHRGLLGVSLGGATTFYAACQHNDVFSRFVMLSSSHYYIQDSLKEMCTNANFEGIKKMYSDVGTKESETEEGCQAYLKSNKELAQIVKDKLGDDVYQFNVIEGSKHEFNDWDKRFKGIVSFVFE